jgi:hypothetical protein
MVISAGIVDSTGRTARRSSCSEIIDVVIGMQRVFRRPPALASVRPQPKSLGSALARTGAYGLRRCAMGVEDLTAQEDQIARLARDGLFNL